MSELLNVVQTIVQNTMKGMKLADMATGTVESVSPLSIKTDITMQAIPEAGLILTDCVTYRTAPVQGGSGGTVVINPGLITGDKVLMLRVSGGNRYIVLSKV